MKYSSFCVCLVTNGYKDGIFGALRLVSHFKAPIYAYVQASIQSLSTYVGGTNSTIWGFMKLVHILLYMVNMLGQATWIQLNFNSYLYERVVIDYQKGGD
jgi:hypothetical protein